MIISDTHDLTLNDAAIDTPFKEPFPEADVVLHCGGLTLGGGIENYEKALEMLSKIDAELKLVIAGSRDLSLDPKFWKEHTASGDCDCDPMESEIALSTMAKAKDSNIRYLEEGKHEFGKSIECFAPDPGECPGIMQLGESSTAPGTFINAS
jgi:predicted phosphodiesterase